MYRFLTILVILLTVASCDLYRQDDFEKQYVVESYLIAGDDLPHVRLSTTLPVDDKYTFDKAAVSGASVEVRLLDDQDNVAQIYDYTERSKGIYWPRQNAVVQPLHKYELFITVPQDNDHVIRTQTLVPGEFEVVSEVPDSVVYQLDPQIEVKTTRSQYPGRQNIYVYNIIAGKPFVKNFTPFYADIADDDTTEAISDFQNNQSNIVNEGNYEVNPDGTITLRLPWIGFAFFGPNKVVTNALDDNFYDFLRSQSVQLGGSTLSPGEIQNVIDHVEGGTGVFGSVASETLSTYIQRPPSVQ